MVMNMNGLLLCWPGSIRFCHFSSCFFRFSFFSVATFLIGATSWKRMLGSLKRAADVMH